jgi:hypothetical protein
MFVLVHISFSTRRMYLLEAACPSSLRVGLIYAGYYPRQNIAALLAVQTSGNLHSTRSVLGNAQLDQMPSTLMQPPF